MAATRRASRRASATHPTAAPWRPDLAAPDSDAERSDAETGTFRCESASSRFSPG